MKKLWVLMVTTTLNVFYLLMPKALCQQHRHGWMVSTSFMYQQAPELGLFRQTDWLFIMVILTLVGWESSVNILPLNCGKN